MTISALESLAGEATLTSSHDQRCWASIERCRYWWTHEDPSFRIPERSHGRSRRAGLANTGDDFRRVLTVELKLAEAVVLI